MPPSAWIGLDEGRGRQSRPEPAGRVSARFSAIVLPVTVRQSPLSRPSLEQLPAARPATPPIRSRSVMWYLPCGFMSARCGTRRPMRAKSSRLQLDTGLVRDREQVEHGVGRAAEGHHRRDGVLEGLLGHDLARPDALFEQAHHRHAARVGEVVAPAVDRRRRRPGRKRHAERLGHRGHRVGGEHAGAGAFGRARVALDRQQLRVVDRARGERPDRLEDRDDVERATAELARAGSCRRRRRPSAGRGGRPP